MLKISTMPRVLVLEEIEIVVTHASIHNETMFSGKQEVYKSPNLANISQKMVIYNKHLHHVCKFMKC